MTNHHITRILATLAIATPITLAAAQPTTISRACQQAITTADTLAIATLLNANERTQLAYDHLNQVAQCTTGE